jgi:hypothetical protein
MYELSQVRESARVPTPVMQRLWTEPLLCALAQSSPIIEYLNSLSSEQGMPKIGLAFPQAAMQSERQECEAYEGKGAGNGECWKHLGISKPERN